MSWLSRAVLLLVVALLAGCGDSGTGGQASGAWERLPEPPLSAREAATAVAVGSEALFLGGSDAPPCPANADCVAPGEPPLRDGAAFDPAAGTWKRIASAPVGFSWASTAVLGDALYLLIPGEKGRPDAPPAFLRYQRRADRWKELRLPPGARGRSLVATDGHVVAYAGSEERGAVKDMAFDPATKEWSGLPDDPLPPTYGRTMAWSGRELVLFAAELVAQPGAEKPSVIIAAAFDPRAGSWRRLRDSEILGGGGRWFAHEGRMIFPALGGADGGETGNWGRTYPNGGILDLDEDRWLPLPGGPDGDEEFAAGTVAGERADVFGVGDWILDAVAGKWIPVPRLEDRGGDNLVSGRALVATGRHVVAFGGARSSGNGSIELVADAWTWSIP